MKYKVLNEDCLQAMRQMDDNSIDFVVTDPPYGLNFMGKHWDSAVPNVDIWKEALRICKPGSMLASFGGSRTHHHLMLALEQAGWEIRDVIMYLYGSGFPKSLDVSKAIDKAKGEEREVVGKSKFFDKGRIKDTKTNSLNAFPGSDFFETAPSSDLAKTFSGYGSALKPAYEPIILAMKPLDGTFAQNAEKWGVAGINIENSRIGTDNTRRKTNDAVSISGWKSVNRSPEVGSFCGRWPANIILDEEAAEMLDQHSGISKSSASKRNNFPSKNNCMAGKNFGHISYGHNDFGGASRFFYCAKTSSRERNAGCEGMELKETRRHNAMGSCPNAKPNPQKATLESNTHPTVKPLSLMRYIIKLLAPPGNPILLDPFAGSGSTLCAAKQLGIAAIGIEKEAEYCEIAKARIEHAKFIPAQPDLFE